MAIIIDGKATSLSMRSEIKKSVEDFANRNGFVPGLAVVIVGSDPASQLYVRNKHNACEDVGIYSEVHELNSSTTEDELLALIDNLNNDDKIHGVLIQLPLPKHINSEKVIARILPQKDVDAFHPENVGKILTGNAVLLPCTPAGVMELLHRYNVKVDGKHCVVIGRSNIVGKPQAMLMLAENATVTICHSHTENLNAIVKEADIIVAAVGKPNFVTADMVRDGAVVIDVGINRMDNGKLCGDVDYGAVVQKASLITPVPGGVGPMTITMLLKNTLKAAESKIRADYR